MQGYKTLLFALAVAIIGVLQAINWSSILPPVYAGYALTAIAIIVSLLRLFTPAPTPPLHLGISERESLSNGW